MTNEQKFNAAAAAVPASHSEAVDMAKENANDMITGDRVGIKYLDDQYHADALATLAMIMDAPTEYGLPALH